MRRTSDWFCDVPCEEDGNYGNDPKCGGRGYLTVFHTSEAVPDEHSTLTLPSKRTDVGVAYEGCYDVDDNSVAFNKLVKSSKWMTNEVRWGFRTLVDEIPNQIFNRHVARG